MEVSSTIKSVYVFTGSFAGAILHLLSFLQTITPKSLLFTLHISDLNPPNKPAANPQHNHPPPFSPLLLSFPSAY